MVINIGRYLSIPDNKTPSERLIVEYLKLTDEGGGGEGI
jgi:hypothetical protein